MIYITRKEHFSASHKLYKQDWTDDKNAEVFGKCSNPNGHGHNYTVYVTAKGEPDVETGFLVNLKIVSEPDQNGYIQGCPLKILKFYNSYQPKRSNIYR